MGTLSTKLLTPDDGPENSTTSPESVIFQDHFATTGEKRWTDDADPDEMARRYTDGAYEISALRARDRWGVLAWPRGPVEENVHLTVKAHRVDGTATEGFGYGLFCRADGQANLYAFTIWANHATIEKRIDGQAHTLRTNGDWTAAVDGDTEKELQVVCTTIGRGSAVELQFWVDGDPKLAYTDKDDPYASGTYGMYAALGKSKGNIGDTLKVQFDDFVATEPASTPSR